MRYKFLSLGLTVFALTLAAAAANPTVHQIAQLFGTDNQSTDFFGNGIISRDGNTMAVGAWDADGTAGEIYVYEKPSGGWTTMNQTARLHPTSQCMLGGNIVISADGSTIAAFAGTCSGGGFLGYGWIEVFVRPASGWADTDQPTAVLSAGPANDVGVSLAMTPDGKTIATTGVFPSQDKVFLYLFDRPAGGWTTMDPTASIRLSNFTEVPDVAMNSSQTIALSNRSDSSVDVYQRSGGGVHQVAQLTTSDGAGICCALTMDTKDIIVEAFAPGTSTGKVYLYTEPPTGWKNTTETAQFSAPNLGSFALFGWNIAKSGNSLLIGGTYTSAAYLYLRPAGGWKTTAQPDVTILSTDPNQQNFGDAVAIVGSTLLIGDGNAGANDNRNGAAYVFQVQ